MAAPLAFSLPASPPPRATRASTTTTTRHRRPFGWGPLRVVSECVFAGLSRSNNRLAAKREAVLASMTARVDMSVAQLSRELADGISELEAHYYSSAVGPS